LGLAEWAVTPFVVRDFFPHQHQAKNINIYGDSEMVIMKVQRSYQAKNPRLRSYRNLVLDLLEEFKEYHFIVIPSKENVAANALVVSATFFSYLYIQVSSTKLRLGTNLQSQTMLIIGKYLKMTNISMDSWRCLEILGI
jgi:hypothetical protein